MIEREITTPTLLLDRQGNLLKPAYAKKMLYEYNRPQVAGRPFGLKEWDFYQVALGDWVLQMTIGHVSYAANFAAKLFSLTTGEQHSFYRLRPFPMRRMPMPLHPNETHVLPAKGKDFDMVYECHADYRTLRMTVSGDDLSTSI